jgi:hypothetical protein
MCNGCPLQSIADTFPGATTELRIWHQGDDTPDRVLLSVTRHGEQLAVHDETCRGAVAKMCLEMDRTMQVGDCRVTIVD